MKDRIASHSRVIVPCLPEALARTMATFENKVVKFGALLVGRCVVVVGASFVAEHRCSPFECACHAGFVLNVGLLGNGNIVAIPFIFPQVSRNRARFWEQHVASLDSSSTAC